jgi:hypothetical protein
MGKNRFSGVSYALLVLAAFSIGPTTGMAATCSVQSPDHTVALVELYTSEGCSSCPPADRWLNNLRSRGISPNHAVPLALHVDYWNGLGWHDPFSQRLFSHRQERLATVNHLNAVYTPQVVLQGRDQRLWYDSSTFQQRLALINHEPALARITLTLTPVNANQLNVRGSAKLAPAYNAAGTGLYVALYQNNLVTKVPRGENAGKTLRHNFVVRKLIGPLPLEHAASKFSETFALKPDWHPGDLGITAFVQNTDDGKVIQATSLPLCEAVASSLSAYRTVGTRD